MENIEPPPEYEGGDRRAPDRYSHRNLMGAVIGSATLIVLTLVSTMILVPIRDMQSQISDMRGEMSALRTRMDRADRDVNDIRAANIVATTTMNGMLTNVTKLATEFHDWKENGHK